MLVATSFSSSTLQLHKVPQDEAPLPNPLQSEGGRDANSSIEGIHRTMTDPWDERYIYAHMKTIKNQPKVGKYTIHGAYGIVV